MTIRKTLCALALAASITGCASSRMERIRPNQLVSSERNFYGNRTIDDILKKDLTRRAYESLKDIPVETQSVMGWNMAIGVNCWSRIASLFLGCGLGKKVLISEGLLKKWGVSSIFHEFIHHAESMGYIDHNKFKRAYKRLKKEFPRHPVIRYVKLSIKAYPTFYFCFSPGKTAERICILGEGMVESRIDRDYALPSYMKEVYKDLLKIDRFPTQTILYGNK